MALTKATNTAAAQAEIDNQQAGSATAAAEPTFDKGVDKSNIVDVVPPVGTVVQTQPAANTAVATTQAGPSARTSLAVADNPALEGLEVDGFSFPFIVNEKGIFKLADTNELIGLGGKSFEFIIHSTAKKLYYKQVIPGADSETQEDAPGFYSYDDPRKVAEPKLTNGTLVSQVLAEWAEEGNKHEIKEYLDVRGEIVDIRHGQPGEFNGTLAVVSVSPTSYTKISGKILEICRQRGADTRQYVVEFSAPSAVGQGKKQFFPFVLRYIRPVTAAVSAA